jgi:hypothetical protein
VRVSPLFKGTPRAVPDTIKERCEGTQDRGDHGSECLDRARFFSGRASVESARSKRKKN